MIFKRGKKQRARRMRRWDVLNRLLDRRPAPTSFLEIGVHEGECGERIAAARKVGVDPVLGESVARKYNTSYETTSDEFFATNDERFDLVFIDGYHTYEQALRDAEGAVSCIKDGGFVVLHDGNPPNYEYQATRHLTGDVWKAVVSLRRMPHLDTYTIDIETGVTVVQLRPNPAPLMLPPVETYAAFEAHRAEALRLIDPLTWLNSVRAEAQP